MPHSTTPVQVLVVGGGAAGFMAAIAAAEAGVGVTLWERGRAVLAKVKISGGGRCNVTNAEQNPGRLVENYPRGGRELRGPLHCFGPRETRAWFESRGVELIAEADGRVFPHTHDATTVVDVLTASARRAGVRVETGVSISELNRVGRGFVAQGRAPLQVEHLLLATGSGAEGFEWARAFGHTVIPPVPSLFTFTIKDGRLSGLAGLTLPTARLDFEGTRFQTNGPVLITHWGLSGPAALRLSAWAARWLSERNYQGVLRVNWTGETRERTLDQLMKARAAHPRRRVESAAAVGLPQRLWERIVFTVGISGNVRWGDAGNDALRRLAGEITESRWSVVGKSAFKDEFVTAGGVALSEVDFKTMESRIVPGLFFAGEILDIDGVTGGFNFQSAWTTGWIAGQAMARRRD